MLQSSQGCDIIKSASKGTALSKYFIKGWAKDNMPKKVKQMLKSKTGIAPSKKAHAFNLKGKARLGYISDYHFNQDPQHFFIAYAPTSLSTQAKKSVMATLHYHVGVVKHRAWFKVDNPMIINVCGIDVHLAPCDDYGQRINSNLPVKRHTISDF